MVMKESGRIEAACSVIIGAELENPSPKLYVIGEKEGGIGIDQDSGIASWRSDRGILSVEGPTAQNLIERETFSENGTTPDPSFVHHTFLSGLLMHTSNMLRIADFLAGLYEGFIDRSLLLAGTLLHDIGKAREFTFSELGLVTEYSTEGNLLSHLAIGAGEVRAVVVELGIPEEKSILLQHLLLSHHGKPEFGAAVKPICAESVLLSQIDMIDSHMEIYQEELAKLQPGEFSGRIFALDGPVYRHL